MHRSFVSTITRCLLLCLLITGPAPAQLAQEAPSQTVIGDSKQQAAVDNLVTIQASIDAKRNTLRDLKEQLKRVEETADRQDLEQRIEHLRNEIAELQQSFEHIALGGVNLSLLAEQPEQRIDWREEVEQISRPLLSTLKELTAKPRQIDSLSREIERRENQLKIIDKAVESIRTFSAHDLPAAAAGPLQQLQTTWEQRREDTQRALDISRFKLDSIKTEGVSWRRAVWEALTEFLHGRGLTLALAVTVSLVIWLLARGLRSLYLKWLYRSPRDSGVKRAPLILYSYRLATAVLMVLATLVVFYARGDLLFLTLAIVALVGVALALRQTLPRYAAEIRLLLGVGPVREKERLVLDGVPLLVESLSVYSVLRNPALDGVVRLPLHMMNNYTSRPAGQEPWFPCQPGDYIQFAGGSIGRVLQQSIELIELSVLDSLVQYRTADFIGQNVRNLSRGEFGIATTFGIDYQHQAICLDIVPERFRSAIGERFIAAGLGTELRSVTVEFKAAGASSLDYQIYVVLAGSAAGAYFRAQRLMQQACVDACNRAGWVIPFPQLTVHTEATTTAPSA
ncbi:MAG: hypothetical protein R3F42_08485 [Pseudomonadota bacterium]